ncbi:RING-type E3 ubiquitin transferase [Heracleum sosnowskyi]|uniref:RING-type E3 ubiquitin transferase n=1 Tax=Heracleum sosnowskyi TaxID=360622 RepID=A0AAD8H7A7_9APIA|nr:RING-type E3 ubiquitin transferase [Heracleum sosnowskyi]
MANLVFAAALIIAVLLLLSTIMFYYIAKASVRSMHLHGQSAESALTMVQEALLIKHEDDDVLDEDLECAVCLNEVCRGENYEMLEKCNHGFHSNCIQAWLQHHSTCPLCRTQVPHTPLLSNVHTYDHYYDILLSYIFSVSGAIFNWLVSPLNLDNILMPSYASQDLFCL